ncbi:MAG: hypothetical protein A3H28_15470 [Acidobacteria bacterium RIFCSPLOWO2_02_FULL_61_28]|nr:MAG: hypothetical protein A3H28_15470 [Acidobacteria bacterium RIFCSPLOWO2_02_FULL_61_28]
MVAGGSWRDHLARDIRGGIASVWGVQRVWLRGVDLNHRSRLAGLWAATGNPRTEVFGVESCLRKEAVAGLLELQLDFAFPRRLVVIVAFGVHDGPGAKPGGPSGAGLVVLLESLLGVFAEADVKAAAGLAPQDVHIIRSTCNTGHLRDSRLGVGVQAVGCGGWI